MNNFTEPLCILTRRVFREYDIFLQVLSKERGFLSVYAFGGVKSRRRFVGCLDAFTIALCTIESSVKKGYLILKEASLIASAKELLPSTTQYGIAQNCALFLRTACRNSVYSSNIYFLFYDLLKALSQEESILPSVSLFFRFVLCALVGYTPILDSCVICTTHIDRIAIPFFSVEKGGVLCHSCHPLSYAFPVRDRETLYVLQYILQCSPLYWSSLPYGRRSIQEACVFIDEYIQHHMGIVWNNGRFVYI